MAEGKGSLEELERLKEKYGPQFKAEARQCKRGDRCIEIGCNYVPAYLKWSGGGLHLQGGYCKRRSCPRLLLPEYLRMLERTRDWRRQDCHWTRQKWWGPVKKKRDQLRGVLT